MWNRRRLTLHTSFPIPAGFPATALATVVAATLLLAGCKGVPVAPAETFTDVTLRAVDGDSCVETTPDPVEIWSREVKGKPSQVRWTALGDTPYRWVLDFKGEGGQKDHFGQRVIPCHGPGRAVTSGLPSQVTHSPGKQVEWTYRVTRQSCGVGPPETVCETDPVVIIREVQR